MKKILVVLIIILSAGLFSGCTVYSGLSYVDTRFSSYYLVVTYDDENLEEIGITGNEDITWMKSKIENLSENYMDQMLKKYRDIINSLNSSGQLTDNERIIYKNHLKMYSGWNDNMYVIEMRFYSLSASRLFLKYGGIYEPAQKVSNLLTTKTAEQYSKIFSRTPDNIISTSLEDYYNLTIINEINGRFGEGAAEGFIGLDFSYMFLSQNSRLHSNGVVVSSQEGTLHCYDSMENNSENIFIFYTLEANRFVWYLLALTVTMCFIAVYLIVIYFRKDKKGSISKKSLSIFDLNVKEDLNKNLNDKDFNKKDLDNKN
jgi:cbb3-type cytochrome oxidase subunit 3